ncbi:hypothetical protein QFZ63_000975 [Streptomyces sp. B3I7]|uniref:peptidoglycan-binding domain-containing protein n=1 Tax=Streptomyces sp. B3I7 TaxID=3042269 RepID=UPI00278477B1|nr:peptidoglycan-binding domain-containing protein [Streptomyces sp. B3I7]MDQ0809261.1 hypothetical protein [Streptomyces sp. B3I7]
MPTPTDPPETGGQPARRRVLEPTYVMRRRRTEALADLVREYRESRDSRESKDSREGWGDRSAGRGTEPEPEYEAVLLEDPRRGEAPATDLATEEMPPVMAPLRPPGVDPGPGVDPRASRRARAVRRAEGPAEGAGFTGRRAAAVVIGVAAAALVGFGAALVVPGVGGPDAAQRAGAPSAPPATGVAASPADTSGADPDGAGTLREGDSGPAVSELQQRLQCIPDVYRDGATDGRYDAVLRAAVARFQLWYGIRGDESGVYGNDTRRDLESRTVR